MKETDDKRITLAHGAGGSVMQSFLKKEILERFSWGKATIGLEALDDGAVINDIVISTDGHTVKPIFFPGGDIGSLAVAGTINDVSAMGAKPIAMASAIVIEEGLPERSLRRVLDSMNAVSLNAKVPIIAGDTKVMENGALDDMIITTTGIGIRSPALDYNLGVVRDIRDFPHNWITDRGLSLGDQIIISGTLGDHGIAVLAARGDLGFQTKIQSDVAPLNGLIHGLLRIGGITCLKDPTRGGLNSVLNEWAEKNRLEISIEEAKIPIKPGVRAASEMLGIDPLEIGNEGKLVIGCIPEKTTELLAYLRSHPLGRDASCIGDVIDKGSDVVLKTLVGGERVLLPSVGDPIPRIC